MMKKLIYIFLLSPIYLIAQNGDKNFIEQNHIEVTGKVETEIIPDEIYVSITLNENDKRGRESIEEQEIQLVRGLKSIGLDTDKILTVQNMYGAYNNLFLRKNEVFKSKQFELLISNTPLLTKVFELLDVLEVSNASITRIDHSEIEKYKRDSKIKALKIAKEKAEYFATAIEQQIGKALFIKEIENTYQNNYNPLNESIVVRGMGIIQSNHNELLDKITFKKIKITAFIEAKFELI